MTVPNKVKITSHSQLGVYEKCSKLFEYQYVKKDRRRVEEDHFIIGDLCHKSLEDYYKGEAPTPIDALHQRWNLWLNEHKLGQLQPHLQSYAYDLQGLHRRARADYTGSDAIRKADGSVADNPAFTKGWKDAVKKNQFDERQEQLDVAALQLLDQSVYGNVSISNCYTETVDIIDGYKHPNSIVEVEYLEFPFSHRIFDDNRQVTDVWNPVELPGTDRLFNGYVDLVGRLHPDLGGGLVLIDHKTEKSEPHPLKTGWHSQLLEYAWAWHQLTGEWPSHIGINHLRSKTCVIAKVVPERAEAAIERAIKLIQEQDEGHFTVKDPFAYNSPCMTFKDGQVSRVCPYFADCHPELAMDLGLVQIPLTEGF